MDALVSDLLMLDTPRWNEDLIDSEVLAEEVKLIKAIPVSRVGLEDTLIWHFSKKGQYTVRSGYHVLVMYNSVQTVGCSW